MTGFLGEYPWLTAWCGDIDITGHRRPQSYYREIVCGLPHRPVPRGAAARAPRPSRSVHSSPWAWSDVVAAGAGPATTASRSSSRSTPTPTRSSCCSTAGRSAPLRSDGSTGTGPSSRRRTNRVSSRPWPGAAARRSAAPRCARPPGRRCSASAADRSEITAEPSDLAYVAITLVDDGGHALHHRRPAWSPSSVDGPGVLQGLGSANPVTEESFTGTACTTFDGRALAVDPSHRCRHDHGDGHRRRLRRAGCRRPRPLIVGCRHDLGAALAPVPRRVGAVHRAPRRAAVDRRGGGARRGGRAGGERARARRPTHRHHEPRLPRRVRLHQRPPGVLARRARAGDRRRRPVPDASCRRHGRGRVLPPRPHTIDGRPRRRRGDGRRHDLARPHRGPAGARRRRARADLREPRRGGRHVESAPPLPDLRRRARVRDDGARGRGRRRAPPTHRARRCSPTSSSASSAGPRVVERG